MEEAEEAHINRKGGMDQTGYDACRKWCWHFDEGESGGMVQWREWHGAAHKFQWWGQHKDYFGGRYGQKIDPE